MTWQNLNGHDPIVTQFQTALTRGRLGTTFLFVGPEGIGKRAFAVGLAKGLLCPNRPDAVLDPCGTCPSCQQIDARTHPDLLIVEKPKDRAFLPVDLLIGDREHRMREGLVHAIGLKPFYGKRKIAIIDDADYFNAEGANALLKTLEEPPIGSVLILIGTSPARQLPTIRSRCQLVRFRPLSEEIVAEILLQEGTVETREEAARLAAASEGSPTTARALADPQLWSFRENLFDALAAVPPQSVPMGRSISQFVDAAGKEAPARRARLRQVVRFAIDFYRQIVHASLGSEVCGETVDPRVGEALHSKNWTPGGPQACLDRCLEVLFQIDRNANQSTLIEGWADDLCRLSTT